MSHLFNNILMHSNRILLNRVLQMNFQPFILGLKQDSPTKPPKVEMKDTGKPVKIYIPEKPKRPQNAYMRFVNEQRPNIMKNHPELKLTGVTKKIGEMWRVADPTMKKQYIEDFKKEYEEYSKQYMKYKESLTEEQIDAIQENAEEKKKAKKKRSLNKFFKETHKPKQPEGPYLRYLRDQSEKLNKPINELMKELKGSYAELPPEEKQKYQSSYLKDSTKYKKELMEWENRMLSEGRTEVVRRKTLENIPHPSRFADKKKVTSE